MSLSKCRQKFLFSYVLLQVGIMFFVGAGFCRNYVFQKMWPSAPVQPWYFYYPSSVTVDNNGYVYVANQRNDCVLKYTLNGLFVTKWGKKGPDAGEFEDPFDIAVDSQGFVYITDMNNHRIQKFSSDGAFIMAWGKKGDGPGEFSQPKGIAIDTNDFIYVADTQNHRIQKFSSQGNFLGTWGKEGNKNGEFKFPTDIVAVNDLIYVADTQNNRIQIFNRSGEYKGKWTVLEYPHGITADNSGNIYITNDQSIYKIASDGTFQQEWGKNLINIFSMPYGPGYFQNDYLFVPDSEKNLIRKISITGKLMDTWSGGTEELSFNTPKGIALSPDGDIIVADTYNNRICKLSSDGILIKTWGKKGTDDGEFNWPHGVASDEDGNIYVADSYNKRIQKFDSSGNFIKAWDGSDNEAGRLNTPYDIVVDGNVLYITDKNNKRVVKFSTEGEFMLSWDSDKNGDKAFKTPHGIAVDSEHNVYVVDAVKRNVQVFDKDGNWLRSWGEKGNDDGRFDLPFGIEAGYIDGEERIVVADSQNHRIQIFKPNGEFVEKFGENGFNPGQMSYPGDVAISPDGRIFVADTDNHRIQVFGKNIRKAIVVAGGGGFFGNRLWPATQVCANMAYRTLLSKGFNVRFLTDPVTFEHDSPYIKANKKNFQDSIENWAKDATTLFIYMVDHGGNGSFRLNELEFLSQEELTGSLDILQSATGCKVVLIIDACMSGTFLPDNLPDDKDRVIITSTQKNEAAYYLSQGAISFSVYFWSALSNCKSLDDSFESAKGYIVASTDDLQHPAIKNNIDLDKIWENNCSSDNNDIPEIFSVNYNTSLNELSAKVSDSDGVSRVWAVIIPSDYDNIDLDSPVIDFNSAELIPDDELDFYAKNLICDKSKSYHVYVHAADKKGNIAVSNPVSTGYEAGNKKALLIFGNPWNQETSLNILNASYQALLFQGYNDEDIYVLCAFDSFENGDDYPTLDKIENYLMSLKGIADDLLIYINGKGSLGKIELNNSEILSKENLADWLNRLQPSVANIVVIIDTDKAGSFIPALKSKENRIIITTSSTDDVSLNPVSFSDFFWNEIRSGESIFKAFTDSRTAMGLWSQSLSSTGPQLDDNGNGISNELSDGVIAKKYKIGIGVKIGQDGISYPDQAFNNKNISEPFVVNSKEEPLIWAKNFNTTLPVEKIFARIIRPDDQSYEVEMNMSNESERYEAVLNNLDLFGKYEISIYALLNNETILFHGSTWGFQTEGMDNFEPDNSAESASYFQFFSGPQLHSLHNKNDADWIKFYAYPDKIYHFHITNPVSATTETFHVKILLFDKNQNLIEERTSSFWHNFKSRGIYYLKIISSDMPFDSTIYKIDIYPESGGMFPGTLTGFITDAKTGERIAGALITIKTKNMDAKIKSLPESGRYTIDLPVSYNLPVLIEANGYETESKIIDITEGGTTLLNVGLTPVSNNDDSNNNIPVDSCPDDPSKTEPGICGCGKKDVDTDGDQIPDCMDNCPNDPNKILPGACGCGVEDKDSDNDSVPDCDDNCPDDPDKTEPGICGCGKKDVDTDGDNTPDCMDKCPDDPDKTEPGICGCGKKDVDTDGDNTPDCMDKCPDDPDKTEPGICGCGKKDVDTDGDGIMDCMELPLPLLTFPANNQIADNLTPVLKIIWPDKLKQKNIKILKTRWQISAMSDFSSLLVDNTKSEDLSKFVVPASKLIYNTRYYWRVKYYTENLESDWSEFFLFGTPEKSDSPEKEDIDEKTPPLSTDGSSGGGSCFILSVCSNPD